MCDVWIWKPLLRPWRPNHYAISWRILNSKLSPHSISGFCHEYCFQTSTSHTQVDVFMFAIVHLPSGPYFLLHAFRILFWSLSLWVNRYIRLTQPEHTLFVSMAKKNINYGVSKIGVPQNGWFIMENLIKIGWFGVPISSCVIFKWQQNHPPWIPVMIPASYSPAWTFKVSFCGWKKKHRCVDGRNPPNQLKWRIYPSICKVLRMSSGCLGFLFSINQILVLPTSTWEISDLKSLTATGYCSFG